MYLSLTNDQIRGRIMKTRLIIVAVVLVLSFFGFFYQPVWRNDDGIVIRRGTAIAAKLWCEKRRMEINGRYDENYKYFGLVLKDIENKNFRVSLNELGTHVDLMSVFAQAWLRPSRW